MKFTGMGYNNTYLNFLLSLNIHVLHSIDAAWFVCHNFTIYTIDGSLLYIFVKFEKKQLSYYKYVYKYNFKLFQEKYLLMHTNAGTYDTYIPTSYVKISRPFIADRFIIIIILLFLGLV